MFKKKKRVAYDFLKSTQKNTKLSRFRKLFEWFSNLLLWFKKSVVFLKNRKVITIVGGIVTIVVFSGNIFTWLVAPSYVIPNYVDLEFKPQEMFVVSPDSLTNNYLLSGDFDIRFRNKGGLSTGKIEIMWDDEKKRICTNAIESIENLNHNEDKLISLPVKYCSYSNITIDDLLAQNDTTFPLKITCAHCGDGNEEQIVDIPVCVRDGNEYLCNNFIGMNTFQKFEGTTTLL
ncbi:MAG: hypothetical protein KAS11_00280 [Candidatus Aenigmarchaeota archaeon]|nr:hypothetical protein [Candidatus Aenigmarchaeota archaeon]